MSHYIYIKIPIKQPVQWRVGRFFRGSRVFVCVLLLLIDIWVDLGEKLDKKKIKCFIIEIQAV